MVGILTGRLAYANSPSTVTSTILFTHPPKVQSRKCDEEIEQRDRATVKVVGAMRKAMLQRRELMKKTKLRGFNAMVVPTLIYGCERCYAE